MSGPLGGSKSRIVACRLPPLQISNITSQPARLSYSAKSKLVKPKLRMLLDCMGLTSCPKSSLSMSCSDLLFLQPGRPWPAVQNLSGIQTLLAPSQQAGLLASSDPCFLCWDHTLITWGRHYRTQTSPVSHLASRNIHTVIPASIQVYVGLHFSLLMISCVKLVETYFKHFIKTSTLAPL